ncbi:MAG: hypothetical protein JSS99_00620 [Actinobacteria bacterium]|nr:hypothetical protein [Actinomycetota bacterium]
MGDETLLVALLGGLHLLGFGFAAVLLLPLLRDERIVPARRGEDEDEGGGGNDRVGPTPRPGPRGGGIPLPDAVPARVRLREPARLADLLPAPRRRREHAPAPLPTRTPARTR